MTIESNMVLGELILDIWSIAAAAEEMNWETEAASDQLEEESVSVK